MKISSDMSKSRARLFALLLLTMLTLVACSNSLGNVKSGVTQSASSNSDVWIHRANNQRTGEYTANAPSEITGVAWKQTVQDKIWEAPVLAGESIYVSTDGKLIEFDAGTGNQKWETKSYKNITVADGVLYYGYHKDLFALNEETKEEQWTFHGSSGYETAPVVANGTVYVGTSDGQLLAIDNKTGLQKWSHKAGLLIKGEIAELSNTVYFVGSTESPISFSSPDGIALDDTLHAINASSGEDLWSFDPLGNVQSFLVADGMLFIATKEQYPNASIVYAIDLQAGKELWSIEPTNSVLVPLSLANGTILIGDDTGMIQAYDVSTRQTKWQFQVNNAIGDISIAQGTVYISSESGYLYALDIHTGQEKWQFQAAKNLVHPPMISNGMIFVASITDVLALH
jgi:outer membrane protein assembly factor BamB